MTDIYLLIWKKYPNDVLTTGKPCYKEHAEYDGAIQVVKTYSFVLTVAL